MIGSAEKMMKTCLHPGRTGNGDVDIHPGAG
jgi:hypothetical protein